MQCEETDWGVRLMDNPFTHKNTNMFIQADIIRPRAKNRAPEIKFWFSGALQQPLRATDVIIWREHLKAVSDAAREEALKMKQVSDPKGVKRKVRRK